MMLAAGLAFNTILCTIPVLLLLTSVFGSFLNSSEMAVQKIQEILDTAFPAQPYATEIKSAIEKMLSDIVSYRTSLGLYGSIILVWTASSLLNAMRTVLNTVFQVKGRFLFFRGLFKNLALTLVLSILFVISNISNWFYILLDTIVERIPQLEQYDISSFVEFAFPVLSYIPAFLMFIVAYRFIPGIVLTWKAILVAAACATILWWFSGVLFGWFLSNYASYNTLYGTYAFLVVFLLWVYYSAIVFVVSAIIGKSHHDHHHAHANR
jgi:membrane protein